MERREHGEDFETATLGGGCFWCLDAIFSRLQGVQQVVVGYAGGHVPNPTYQQVCAGTTGHAEVVQVTFDPTILSYGEVLELFFAFHDPTTPDRQGADVGPQYRSIILYHDQAQRQTAQELIRALDADSPWGRPLVTEVAPLETFYPAEAYHQRYYEKNPTQGYCRAVIAPKVAKLRRKFSARLKESLSR